MVKLLESTKSFFMKCKRVWLVLRKPTKEEFKTITKVSAIGIIILGLFGFLISITLKAFNLQ